MKGIDAVEYFDALDGLGAEVLVRDENGDYMSYYYISDADTSDGGVAEGWADGDGALLEGSVKLPVGAGVWIRLAKTEADASFTFAGEVIGDATVEVAFNEGFTIMNNPYPTALNPAKLSMKDVKAVGYFDALDGLGAEMLVRDEAGDYMSYYYIEDADMIDGSVGTAWADGDGAEVDEEIVAVGAAFWLRSVEAGSVVFSL